MLFTDQQINHWFIIVTFQLCDQLIANGQWCVQLLAWIFRAMIDWSWGWTNSMQNFLVRSMSLCHMYCTFSSNPSPVWFHIIHQLNHFLMYIGEATITCTVWNIGRVPYRVSPLSLIYVRVSWHPMHGSCC